MTRITIDLAVDLTANPKVRPVQILMAHNLSAAEMEAIREWLAVVAPGQYLCRDGSILPFVHAAPIAPAQDSAVADLKRSVDGLTAEVSRVRCLLSRRVVGSA